jgi:hypothetical protein
MKNILDRIAGLLDCWIAGLLIGGLEDWRIGGLLIVDFWIEGLRDCWIEGLRD